MVQYVDHTLFSFSLLLADPDVWLKPTIKEDSFYYYEYVLIYANELVLSHCDVKKAFNDFYDF